MDFIRRRLLSTAAGAPLAAVASCTQWSHRSENLSRFDAVVDASALSSASQNEGARHDGVAYFSTIARAIDAAPNDGLKPWRVWVKRGRYREKIEVTRPNVHLIGEDRASCVITFDAYAGQKKVDGGGVWTTFGCATLTVRAPDFTASHLTIENDFDYLSNDAKSTSDPSYTNDPQAVALMLAKGSDRAALEHVTITGFQDTLFVDAGRSHFRHCDISGNVDFIFGAGQALFEFCDVISRARRKPNVAPHGYVTAPSTQLSDQYGLVFQRCKLLREDARVPPNSHALGRPWHPAVTFADGRYADPNAVGSSVFLDCFMDDHIAVDGWWSMTGLQKSGPTRTLFLAEDARFFEYRSTGPGAPATTATKRRQLSDDQAKAYGAAKVLRGWQAFGTRS